MLSHSSACAGLVRTLDGKTHEGAVYLTETGELSVRSPMGTAESMPLNNVLSALFRTSESDPQASAPGRWMGKDIGQVGVAGSARFTGGVATLRAGGTNIGGAADSGYFVHQTMTGDGEIVARLTAFQETTRDALAGLMIRPSVEASSPCVAVLSRAGGETRFMSRARLGAVMKDTEAGAAGASCWLRLERRGDEFRASVSGDGQNWESMGTQTVSMPPRVLVGLVGCSRKAAAVSTATFERASVSTVEMGEAEASSHVPSKGVVLRRGSLLSGSVIAFDGSTITMQDQSRSIPAAEVAHILYKPLRPEQARKLRPGQTGVFLASGDFLEGEVVGIANSKVRISSVLFGLRSEELYKVAAIILRDPAPVPTQYEIRLRSGSVLLVDQVKGGKEALIIHDPGVGQLQVSGSQILEIRAGMARFTSLLDLKPIQSDKAGGVVFNDTIGGVAMSLGGRACQRGIGLSVGGGVSYDLGKNGRVFTFRAGVPDGVLPAASVRFVVRADGKEIHRSAPRTSLDEPLSVMLNVSGVKVLSLHVEAADGLAVGASGLFGDPALVK